MRTERNPLKIIERALQEREADYHDIAYGGFENPEQNALRFLIEHQKKSCYVLCTRSNHNRCLVVFRSTEADTHLPWAGDEIDRFLKQFNITVDALQPGGEFFHEESEVSYRATIGRLDQMSTRAITDFLLEKARLLIAVAGILEFASKQTLPLDQAMIEKLVGVYADPE